MSNVIDFIEYKKRRGEEKANFEASFTSLEELIEYIERNQHPLHGAGSDDIIFTDSYGDTHSFTITASFELDDWIVWPNNDDEEN